MISASGAVCSSASLSAPALKPLQLVGAQELETRTELPAVVLDRGPHGGIGRIVDDHHAFEIGPVERGHGIERLAQHVGRLAASGDMDRHQRRALRHAGAWREQPAAFGAEQDGGKLFNAPLHDHDERHQQSCADEQRDLRAEHEIMRDPIVDNIGRPGADGTGGERKHAGLCRGWPRNAEDRDREQQPDGQRRHHLRQEVRRLHRTGKGEFRIPVGVEDAPIGPDAAFIGLPRLIEGFDDRIIDAHRVRAGDEIAHDLCLSDRARLGVLAIEPGARPAELGDHDAFAGIGLAQPLIDLHGVIDGRRSRGGLPNRAGCARPDSQPRTPVRDGRAIRPTLRRWSPGPIPRASRAESWR